MNRLVLVSILAFNLAGAIGATELVPGQNQIDGESFMEHLKQVYKTAETYSHTCSWIQTAEGLDGMDSMFIDGKERTSSFFFQRPSKIAIHIDDQHIITDGTKIWSLDLKSGRYTEDPISDEVSLAWSIVGHYHPMDMPFLSVIDYLVSEIEGDSAPCQESESSETWVPTVSTEELDGTPGKRVSWSVEAEEGKSRGGMWVSDINGAIFELEAFATGQHWPGGHDSGIEPVSYVITTRISCESVEINPVLAPGLFTLVPDETMKKVDSFYPSSFDMRPPWEDRVAPTVGLTDGSLDEIDGNRLITRSSLDHVGAGGHVGVTTTDEDFDGVPDVLIIGFSGVFSVYNGAIGEIRSVGLRGRPTFGSLRTIVPIANGGETLWLAETDHYHSESSSSRSTASLHGPDGKEWWVYSPEIPDERASKMFLEAGDLDGDGVSEIVVGVVVEHHQKTGERSYRVDTETSMLTILDIDGNRLVQRSIGSEIHGIEIRDPVFSQPATILCITSAGIEEFALEP